MDRKIFFTIIGVICSMVMWGFVLTFPAFAGTGIKIQNPLEIDNLEELISRMSGIIRSLVIVVLVMVIVYGGWVRLTAGDNADAIGRSQKIIVGALIGFVIIVLAPVIVEFVGGLIGVRSTLVNL